MAVHGHSRDGKGAPKAVNEPVEFDDHAVAGWHNGELSDQSRALVGTSSDFRQHRQRVIRTCRGNRLAIQNCTGRDKQPAGVNCPWPGRLAIFFADARALPVVGGSTTVACAGFEHHACRFLDGHGVRDGAHLFEDGGAIRVFGRRLPVYCMIRDGQRYVAFCRFNVSSVSCYRNLARQLACRRFTRAIDVIGTAEAGIDGGQHIGRDCVLIGQTDNVNRCIRPAFEPFGKGFGNRYIGLASRSSGLGKAFIGRTQRLLVMWRVALPFAAGRGIDIGNSRQPRDSPRFGVERIPAGGSDGGHGRDAGNKQAFPGRHMSGIAWPGGRFCVRFARPRRCCPALVRMLSGPQAQLFRQVADHGKSSSARTMRPSTENSSTALAARR